MGLETKNDLGHIKNKHLRRVLNALINTGDYARYPFFIALAIALYTGAYFLENVIMEVFANWTWMFCASSFTRELHRKIQRQARDREIEWAVRHDLDKTTVMAMGEAAGQIQTLKEKTAEIEKKYDTEMKWKIL